MSKPLGKPDRIVVALGGNALGNTPEEQIEKVGHAAHALLGLIEQGNEIIITHGNGPQVGMIQNAFFAAHDAIGTPAMDLPECGAMSQGYIGYHLQQGIGREMHRRYKRWHAATVVTQIECDPDDPAFANPTKPIGPFYTEEQAREIMAENPEMVFVEDSGRGWRRVVASPEPKKIVEADSILNLLDNEFIVIACGGGGIPVVRDYNNKGCYKGVAAVIDKDMGGELLAEDCGADVSVPADRRRARRHQLRQARPAGARGAHRRRGRAPRRRGPVWQGLHGAQGPRRHQVRALPQGPHLHHRRPRQGRRDHGRPLRHPHLRLNHAPFSRVTCKLTSLPDVPAPPAGASLFWPRWGFYV